MNGSLILERKINLSEKQESFIDYLDVSKGTLKTYEEGIRVFLNYLSSKNISNPTRNDLRAFREEFRQKVSNNTLNSYLTSIRRFFRYLELNKIYEDITKDVKNIKTSSIPKKQVLTEKQIKDIYWSLTDEREKCLFSLAISTGLRGTEMANAKIEDIKLYNGEVVLWVKCKGHDSYDEYVKLSNDVLSDIKQYIGNRESGYIFISTSNNNYGSGVTTTTLRREIKKIFKRFGLDDDGFSLHSTRRTSATMAYNCGADIKQIQQMLHHKSLVTTNRYINQTTRDNNKIEYNISDVIFGK